MEIDNYFHLMKMNVFRLFILSVLVSLSSSAAAQSSKGFLFGEYTVKSIPVNRDSLDSVARLNLLRIIEPIVFCEFYSSQTLKLKWNRRFKITDDRAITALGFNTDNPTIYGSYKIKNDTLILKYRYTIQHFNKMMGKSRVKTKFKQKDQPAPIKRFARIEKHRFKISQLHYWHRKR